MDYARILEKAKSYEKDMTRFLRDMIAIPSESCDEKRVIHRIKEEMEKVGFDRVEIEMSNHILRLRDGLLVEDEANPTPAPASELTW